MDFAVLCDTPDARKYDYIPFPETDLWGVIMPADAPLAQKKTVCIDVVREGLGYQLAFEHLIDTSPDSSLVFRPLSPKLETRFFLIWNKYQTFTPIAERFLAQVRESFVLPPPLPV